MIGNYQRKMHYLSRRNGGHCVIAEAHGAWAPITDLHHRHARSKWARRKFPLFIDSLWNLLPVNNKWHLRYGSFARISKYEAEKRERFLERHPMIAKAVNMEDTWYTFSPQS